VNLDWIGGAGGPEGPKVHLHISGIFVPGSRDPGDDQRTVLRADGRVRAASHQPPLSLAEGEPEIPRLCRTLPRHFHATDQRPLRVPRSYREVPDEFPGDGVDDAKAGDEPRAQYEANLVRLSIDEEDVLLWVCLPREPGLRRLDAYREGADSTQGKATICITGGTEDLAHCGWTR